LSLSLPLVVFATRRSRSREDPLTSLLERVEQGQLGVVPLEPLEPLFEDEGTANMNTKQQER
jgi:hypothetical protein